MCHNSKWSQSSFNRQHKHWNGPYLEAGLGYPCCFIWDHFELSKGLINKWDLVKLKFALHKNTGKFASLTKRARSTSFLLISNVSILLHSKKRKKKPEMGDFHVSKRLFLRVQIFFVHLFALRYQIPWLNCLTKFGYTMSQMKHIRCHVLSWFAQSLYNDNTSMFQVFLFPLPFLGSTEHFSLKPSLSIKQRRRKERLCSLTRKFWRISGCGKVELH